MISDLGFHGASDLFDDRRGWARLSLALTDETLDAGLERLAAALAE